MAKPLEEWSIDELRMEAVRVAEELARRAAVPAVAGGKKQRVDVVRACENWVRGVAWDETFTLEMVDDEFSLHERKAQQELAPLERERLVQLWLALRSERYRSAA
jgi:ABC-type proline/glycine betaine transport system ATPase subunit